MSKILIYTVRNNGFWAGASEAYAKGFEALGEEVIRLPVDVPGYEQQLSKILSEEDIYFSFGHKADGISLKLDSGKELYSVLDFPHVSVLDDAPYNIVTSEVRNFNCNSIILCVGDEDHARMINNHLELYKANVKTVQFIPNASPQIPDEKNLTCGRDIEVLHCATYYGQPVRMWRNMNFGKGIKFLLEDIADYLETHEETVYRAAETVLKAQYTQTDMLVKKIEPFLVYLFMYIKTYRRCKLIEKLIEARIKFVVCGDSWKSSPYTDKLKIYPSMSYYDAIALYKQAKILIQDNAEFNNGVHARVFDGALSGTVIVSEWGKWMSEHFADGKEICFFHWKALEEVPLIINTLLEDEAVRLEVAGNMYAKVADHYLPVNIAKNILTLVDLFHN